MRELTVVGLDLDGKRIICETGDSGEKFVLASNDRLRAGASVEQVASAAGVDIGRVERFAHPVLLERSRAAELATAAHPVLADGPAVLTLLETVTSALVARGLDPDATSWD